MAGSSSPCAACKLLRRRCAKDCIFAPYFPPDDPHKFAIVHKVFGASNVSKMLQELPVHHRADAVSSLVYEANARVKDPVYGCVGAISYLQNQVSQLQMQLAVAQAEILCLHMQHESSASASAASSSSSLLNQQADVVHDEDYIIKPFANLHNSGGGFANFPQFVNFSSSSSSSASAGNVLLVQEPLKREYLWT